MKEEKRLRAKSAVKVIKSHLSPNTTIPYHISPDKDNKDIEVIRDPIGAPTEIRVAISSSRLDSYNSNRSVIREIGSIAKNIANYQLDNKVHA